MERYYKVSELARMTGFDRHAIYDAIRRGELPCVRLNGSRHGTRVSESAWTEFIRAKEQRGAP